jgi:hypothetical protein
LPLVRREDNGAIFFKGDRGLTSVHDLQLWTKGVKHDLHNKDSECEHARITQYNLVQRRCSVTHGAQLLGGFDGKLEVLERLLVVRSVPPREIEPGN